MSACASWPRSRHSPGSPGTDDLGKIRPEASLQIIDPRIHRKMSPQARKAGSDAAGEPPAVAGTSASANPDEPKVVLYGEGTASGVRASTEGVNTP